MIYLDYHATTPVDARVLEAMLPFFSEHFGNAASRQHPFGWAASDAVERARKQVAALLGAGSKDVVFTSGATEANNLAIKGAAKARLTPIVKNALRNEINQLALKAVVSSGRSNLTGRLLKHINEGAATLGIEVLDVRIKRINLPQDSDILDSVFNRMRAERTRVANALRAEGQQAAEGIRAEADRQRQVLIADAEREAQLQRGQGDARAAEVGAAAYGQDAEFYAFYRSLEAYRTSLGDGKAVMVLDPDSEFLRYFGTDRH